MGTMVYFLLNRSCRFLYFLSRTHIEALRVAKGSPQGSFLVLGSIPKAVDDINPALPRRSNLVIAHHSHSFGSLRSCRIYLINSRTRYCYGGILPQNIMVAPKIEYHRGT